MVGGRGQAGGKGDLVPNLILPVHLIKNGRTGMQCKPSKQRSENTVDCEKSS